MVLDVDNEKTDPGTQVFMYPKHGGTNQQWYDDPITGTIKSQLNDFCLDIMGGHLVLNPYESGKTDQQWERRGAVIANRKETNIVLDVFESDKNPGAKVIKHKAHGGANQSWTFDDVD